MVNFGFSGQFESKSQKCSDSRRIGANTVEDLFVNFWSFDVTLSLSTGLGNVIRLGCFAELNMTLICVAHLRLVTPGLTRSPGG